MDPRILRYDDKAGFAGKLLGVVTFTDGRSCCVWDHDLHARCQELAREKVTPVRYAFRTSAKWGDTLTDISRAAAYADAYDAARAADEQRGRLGPNTYLGRRIAKGVA